MIVIKLKSSVILPIVDNDKLIFEVMEKIISISDFKIDEVVFLEKKIRSIFYLKPIREKELSEEKTVKYFYSQLEKIIVLENSESSCVLEFLKKIIAEYFGGGD